MRRMVWVVLVAGVALAEVDERVAEQLIAIKRIHVEKLGGGEASDQIRDMIIASLQKAGLFVLTENPDRADAVLRGSAEDLIYTDVHQTSENVDARGSIGLGTPRATSSSSNTRRGSLYLSGGAGQSESERTQERRHEATAAVRLVDKEGDVIWSTTQESRGAKFRGASADVAERVTKQLVLDYDRIKSRRFRTDPAGGAATSLKDPDPLVK